MHNRQLKRTDPISLSSLFSYRCAILFRLSAETNEKKNLFRGMTNVRTNERTNEAATDLRAVIRQKRFNNRPEAARCHISTDELRMDRF